tara:strand:- start:2836 stop:3033 length:198 start_codon:yes stop_codon:yes gene_type:complete
MLAHAPIVATQDLVRKMSEKYESMTREELLAEVKRMSEGIKQILKEHHFPFIISGMKMELKGLLE